ncbi:MAG: hypothetical protein MUF42_08875 [Cytophagaceae bacterium]|jgi:hypothetical protein|nr:hypothetical protein [Cytophagaceae bacterium]
MNKQTFLQLLQQPSPITEDQLRDLETFVQQYPYCQSAHLLIARYYASNGHMLAGLKVKKAALYAADRQHLKALIESENESNPLLIKKTLEFIPEEAKQEAVLEPIKSETEVKQEIQQWQEQQRDKKQLSQEKEIEQKELTAIPEALTHDSKEPQLQTTSNDQLLEELRQSLLKLRDAKRNALEKEKTLDSPEPLLAKEPDTWGEPETQAEIRKEELSNAEERDVPIQQEIEIHTQEQSTEIPELKEEKIEIPEQEILSTEPVMPDTIPSESIPVLHSETNWTASLHIHDWKYTGSLDQYYPTNSIRISRSDEYLAVDDQEASLMIQYLDHLNLQRQIFRKNKKKEEEIINRLSTEEPVMPKLNARDLPPETEDLSTRSTTLQKGPVSENFAKILVLQGKRDKAIEIYTELCLKFPEKKPYFESQIEKLKSI